VSQHLDCGGRILDLTRPVIMGIINVTPDSFSDGGQFFDTKLAIEHGLQLAEEGADILDIGGESTRPGARSPNLQEELDRVIPVIDALRKHTDLPISIDTSDATVMRRAVESGAGFINDVRGFGHDDAIQAAVDCGVPVCVMHMQGEPGTMQQNPCYLNVVSEVQAFLVERANRLINAGVSAARIVIDPGFGFGKNLQHNIDLLAALEHLKDSGFPVLAGLSRKSMIVKILGKADPARLGPSVALALRALQNGASILRVHDVLVTREAVQVWQAIAK
jgi:dihydropteroate synthase